MIALLLTFALQALPDNPVAAAAHALGRSGFKEGAAPAESPTKFKSDGTRRTLAAYAKTLGDTDEQRKALEKQIAGLIESYESSAAQVGAPGDASGALAFSIAVLHSTARGVELDDAAFLALIERFRASLDVPAVRGASDVQKQELYEAALCRVATVLSVAPYAETDAQKAELKKLAGSMIEQLIGAGVDQLTLKGKDVALKAAPAASPKPAPAGVAEGFTITPPPDWTVEQGWHVRRIVEAPSGVRRISTAAVRFPDAVEPRADMGVVLGDLWKTLVPPELAGRHTTMVYRRYLGDGLMAQFVFGAGREKDRKSNSMYSLYLIDLGARWQPVVIGQTYDEPDDPFQSNMDRMADGSWPTSGAEAEKFLATLRCPAAKGRPIVSKEALVGEYSYGDASTLTYENIYTGATSMSVVSYGGTLHLKADGRFLYTNSGMTGVGGATRVTQDRDEGTWDIRGDLLVLTMTTTPGKEKTWKFAGLTSFSDGVKVAVLLFPINKVPSAYFYNSRGEWFSTAKPK